MPRMTYAGRTVAAVVLFTAGLLACQSENDRPASAGSDTAPQTPTASADPDVPPGGNPQPGGADTPLTIDIASAPVVRWDPGNGKTTIVVQFSVKGPQGLPLQESDLTIGLNIDERPLDVESILEKSSRELAVNLYFALVLDASFSMIQHQPPAFEPMKQAARRSYRTVLDSWTGRPGEVAFSLMWFDEIVNQSLFDENTQRGWNPDDILDIPDPVPGRATKLYSATQAMVTFLRNEFQRGVFNNPRDRYVLLLFSDGADNYSFFDNSAFEALHSTPRGALFRRFGTPATTLTELTENIAAFPNLTVHVIGLGSAVNETELQAIAEAGNGVLQINPSSENIDQLFQRVVDELTTIQTHGATIPLPPGEYTFSLVVTEKGSGMTATKSFRFRGGDAGTTLLSEFQ